MNCDNCNKDLEHERPSCVRCITFLLDNSIKRERNRIKQIIEAKFDYQWESENFNSDGGFEMFKLDLLSQIEGDKE